MELKGVTLSGFEYVIDKNKLDDMEFFELLGEIDENPLLLPKLLEKLLGKDGKKKLYDHVREDSGKVPIARIHIELTNIFNNHKEIKN